MHKHLTKCTISIMILATTLLSSKLVAQKDTTERPDKLYSMSAVGVSIPIADTKQYFKPKFSTALGLNIGLGDKGYFLYPKLSLSAYSLHQIVTDPGYTYKLQRARTTTYLLNMGLGYRAFWGSWSFYGFAGAGGGFILAPRVQLDAIDDLATIDNKKINTLLTESGLGIEYNADGVTLFIESSYMHGFSNIEGRPLNAVPFLFGVKPHLNHLFNWKR